MKVVLLYGKSGSGKTTITRALKNKYPYMFHIVESYTNRPARYDGEDGHIFVDTDTIKDIINDDSMVVASTKYGDYFYCSSIKQFADNKINLYVVDLRGIRDMLNYKTLHSKLGLELFIVEVKRDCINVSESRSVRDVDVFKFSDFEGSVFFNDGSVGGGVDVLGGLIFDFFW